MSVSTKTTGEGMVRDSDFNFTVTLSDTSINGTYGDMEFTNGKASFTLKDGEITGANDLPAGTTFTVTETNANQDAYEVEQESQTGEIVEGKPANIKFENKRVNGVFNITTTTASTEANTLFGLENHTFHPPILITKENKPVDGILNGNEVVNGICYIDIKANDTTQLLIPDGYGMYFDVSNFYADGIFGGYTWYRCSNYYSEGDIIFRKTIIADKNSPHDYSVEGIEIILSKEYRFSKASVDSSNSRIDSGKDCFFTLTFSNNDGLLPNGTIYNIDYENGIGKIKLQANNSVLSNVYFPAKWKITLTEEDAEGYKVEYSQTAFDKTDDSYDFETNNNSSGTISILNTKIDAASLSSQSKLRASAKSNNESFTFTAEAPTESTESDSDDSDNSADSAE